MNPLTMEQGSQDSRFAIHSPTVDQEGWEFADRGMIGANYRSYCEVSRAIVPADVVCTPRIFCPAGQVVLRGTNSRVCGSREVLRSELLDTLLTI